MVKKTSRVVSLLVDELLSLNETRTHTHTIYTVYRHNTRRKKKRKSQTMTQNWKGSSGKVPVLLFGLWSFEHHDLVTSGYRSLMILA